MPFVASALPLDPVVTLSHGLKSTRRRPHAGEKATAGKVTLAPRERPWTTVRWPRFTVPRQQPQILFKPGMVAGVRVGPGQQISMAKGHAPQGAPPAPGEGFSFLLGAPGRDWVVSPHLFHGAYGSVSFAYNRMGERFAVKSVRLPPKDLPAAEAREGGLQPLPELYDEVTRASVIRSSIESRLCNGSPTSLLANTPWLRHRHGRFAVHDIILDDASSEAHVVMTAQQGSLWDLWGIKPLLPAHDRYLAAKSLAIQGFAELSVMHEWALYGHGDVSLGNVLYDRCGRMRLFDFGFAEPLDRPNGQGHKKGLWGTLLVPEMLGAPRTRLGAAADTFALAVAIFEMAGAPHEGYYNPFYLQAQGGSSAQVRAHVHRVIQRLRTFKLELAPLNGFIHAEDIPRSSQRDLVNFFWPLAEADAPLAELLLNGAMQVDPDLRSSSWGLLSDLHELDNEGETMDWVGYQKMIAKVVSGDSRSASLRNDAQAFVRAFVPQQPPRHGSLLPHGAHQAAGYGWLFALPYVKQSLAWLLGSCQPRVPMARPRATRDVIEAMV